MNLSTFVDIFFRQVDDAAVSLWWFMTSTVLLTLGRLPKALEIARALHGAGCRVLVAEPFGRHVCKPSRAVSRSFKTTAPNTDRSAYLADLARIVRDEAVDIVLPVSEEALHAAALPPLLPAGVRLASADLATLQGLHDKLAFIGKAAGLGFAVPETWAAGDPRAKAMALRRDVVVKPVHSCSGLGVRILKAGTATDEVLRTGDEPAVAQAFVAGRHVSTCSIASNGRILGTAIYEGTVFAGTVAVCFKRVTDLPVIDDWVSSFCGKTGHSGFISFDFIVDDQGQPWPIECNPRVTSGVHFFHPADLAAAILDPDRMATIRFKDKDRFQTAYSTLTEAYAQIFRFSEFRRRMAEMIRSRDVVWSMSDPLPFLLMTPMSWDMLGPSIFKGVGLNEAAMGDIAWFGPSPAESVNPATGTMARQTGPLAEVMTHGG